MNDTDMYSFTDPTDAYGNTLTVMPVEAAVYHGSIPVVSLGVNIHPDYTDPETPIVYIPLGDVEAVVTAIRAAAAQVANPR